MTQPERGCLTCALWDRSDHISQRRRQEAGILGARCKWASAEAYPDAVDERVRPIASRFMWRGAGADCPCWKPDDRGRQA